MIHPLASKRKSALYGSDQAECGELQELTMCVLTCLSIWLHYRIGRIIQCVCSTVLYYIHFYVELYSHVANVVFCKIKTSLSSHSQVSRDQC